MSRDQAEGSPGKPPWWAAKVIMAVPHSALGDFPKLLMVEVLRIWKGSDGVFMGAGPMADRLGCSRERVEEVRRALQADGLLFSIKRPERRTASWYVTLPADCIPREPTDASAIEAAKRLGGRLLEARGEWRTDRTPVDPAKRPPQWRTPRTLIPSDDEALTGVRGQGEWRTVGVEPACAAHAPEVFQPPPSHPQEVRMTSNLPPISDVGTDSRAAQEPEEEVGQMRALPGARDHASDAPRRGPISIGNALRGSDWRGLLTENGCLPGPRLASLATQERKTPWAEPSLVLRGPWPGSAEYPAEAAA